jgi:hypothetical protein
MPRRFSRPSQSLRFHANAEKRLLPLTSHLKVTNLLRVSSLLSSNAVAALVDIAKVRLGIAFRSRLEHDPFGDVAILQMKDIDESAGLSYNGAIRGMLPKERPDILLREGDLVFRSRGRSTGAALVGSDVPPAILAAPLLLIRPVRVLPGFLYWFINSAPVQAQLASLAAGTSVQMISADSLRTLQVPVPPVAAQERIAEIARLVRREEDLLNTIAKRRNQLVTHMLMNYALQGPKGASR